jgi:hypothetical protein
MTELERTVTLLVSADAAYAFLSDPAHLAAYVPVMEHVDTEVIDETEATDPPADPPPGPSRFFADARTRTVEWSAQGAGLELVITVEQGTSRTSQVAVRLTADDAADRTTLDGILDEIVASLRRVIPRD